MRFSFPYDSPKGLKNHTLRQRIFGAAADQDACLVPKPRILEGKWGGQRDSNPRPQDSQNCVHVAGKRLRKVQYLCGDSDRANAMWHVKKHQEEPEIPSNEEYGTGSS